MPRRTTILALLASIVVVITTIVVGLSTILSGRTAAPLNPGPPASRKLTEHVLLVVVDGLRYDYAIDPSKAPNFARRMHEHAHAEATASRVTMTSAAIFSFATGRRGDFSHVVLNLHAQNMGFNSIIANARTARMRVGLVGDQTWKQAYDAFDSEYLDDKDISIETDNSIEMLEASTRMVTTEPRPALMVAHVISPDHQGHAYGTASQKYLAFLKVFDADLERFLRTVPADTTVLVVSDHGATDTGAHGTDIASVRRTPVFAFGPGIGAPREGLRYEQVDLAPTMAALLGIPGPAHGRGTVATELLAVSPDEAAAIRCADVARLPALARAEGRPEVATTLETVEAPCSSASASASASASTSPSASAASSVTAEETSAAALRAARLYDTEVDRGQDSSSNTMMMIAMLVLAIFLAACIPLVGVIAEHRGGFGRSVAFLVPLALAALILVLTREVEKVTPPFHNVIRALLFVAGNLALLLGVVRPSLGARVFAAWPLLAASLLPGAIAWSYPPNAQPEALVTLLLGGVLWAWLARRGSVPERWSRTLALLVVGLLGLIVFGIVQDGPIRQEIAGHLAFRALMLALTVVWLAVGARGREVTPRRIDVLVACAIAPASLVLRSVTGSLVAQIVLIGGVIASIALARKQRWTLVVASLFASYAMVSRPIEHLAVISAAMTAEAVGSMLVDGLSIDRVAAHAATSPVRDRLWVACVAGAMFFGILFLLRMGLQGGLDFANMDLNAGVWGDEQPSQVRVGLCITWKYVCALLLVMGCFLRALDPALRRDVLAISLLAWVGRAAVHACVLLYCRSSFWTSLRVLSDLAIVLITALLVLSWVVREVVRRTSDELSTETPALDS